MQIVGKPIAVIFVQAVFRTYPDIPRLVLTDMRDLIARKLFRGKELPCLPEGYEATQDYRGSYHISLHILLFSSKHEATDRRKLHNS